VLGLVLVAGLLQIRRAESMADRRAAEIVGDGDAVIYALTRSAVSHPVEQQVIEHYEKQVLSNLQNPTLADLVQSLKAGNDPVGDINWRVRLLRTHPLVVERIANIVNHFGTSIA
jgi:Zn-dependent protease with chaperone function